MTEFRARRLPTEQGAAAWNRILGPQPPARPLTEDCTADAVIVGGGIAGLTAARRLLELEPTARIVLLEAGRIAEGTAGRNSGFMIDLPHDLTSEDYAGAGDDRAVIGLNRHAIAYARAAVEAYQIDRNYFDEAGKVNGAVSAAADDRNASYARHLDQLGEAHERLDAKDMLALTGSRYYRSGLYTPGTVMVQPAGYVRGLAGGLADAVAIHEESPVRALEETGCDWRVRTSAASVSTPRVILATNGHLESFGFETGRLLHVFLFAAMTQELDTNAVAQLGGRPRWGITPSDPMGTTMRRIDTGQGGNRLVTRTTAVLRSAMRPSRGDLVRAGRTMRAKFDARFPALRGMAMEYTWSGHLCLSRNGVSVMRALAPGLYSACVQNGLGLTRGTLTGMGAAEMAAGVETDVTRALGAEAKPTRLPPNPLRDIGGNLTLRWKGWQARAE